MKDGESLDEWRNVPEEYPNIQSDGLRFLVAFCLQRFLLAPVFWIYTRILNRTEFVGLENLKDVSGRSFLLCANHTSSWDIWSAFEVGFKATSYFSNKYYLCGLGAIERLGPSWLRWLTCSAGVIAVNRKKGLEQLAMQDLDRLLSEGQKAVACLIYPEGTRSKDGRLAKTFKAGAGWVQARHQLPIVPVYQIHYNRLPGFGVRLKIVIGKVMEFDTKAVADSPTTWIRTTQKIMDRLRLMEQEVNPLPEEIPAKAEALSPAVPHYCSLPAPTNNQLLWSKQLTDAGYPAFVHITADTDCEVLDAHLTHGDVSFEDEADQNWLNQRFLTLARKVRALHVRGYATVREELILYRFGGTNLNELHVRCVLPDTCNVFLQPVASQILQGLVDRQLLSEDAMQRALLEPLATHITYDCTSELSMPLSHIPLMRQSLQATQGKVRLGAIGGFACGRGVKALLALGVDFLQSESIHLLFAESGLAHDYRQRLWKARPADFQRAPVAQWMRTGSMVEVFRFGSLYPRMARKFLTYIESQKSLSDLTAEEEAQLLELCACGSLGEAEMLAREQFGVSRPGLCSSEAKTDRLKLLCIYALNRCEEAVTKGETRDPRYVLLRAGPEICRFTQSFDKEKFPAAADAIRHLMNCDAVQ